ncbi:Ig-like domain-containing protein [Arenibacter palladensis]|uniref:Ig-like domain-containing protein n=1 Tax=Arenibacter palladensis TaxID=237373 RepID=UPI0015B6BE95|nr:Ig-like domain-containing protein [Arenibacter palladensis]
MITNSGFGQTRVFANGIISQSNTDNSANAIDTDLSTKASIRAKDFPGSYLGALELEFPSLIPAETTAYVKIDADEPILAPLLAGGLGDFLGAVAVSKQEFSVQVKNVNTVVLQGDSNDAGEFGTSRMRLVMNEAGEYFIVVTPDQAFNRIRIINRIDQGLTSIGPKRLGVYGAFYNTSEVIGDCGVPSFTSYDGSNISSGLLGIGGVGVNDPENAIDDDDNSFSELNLGLIGIGSSIEQILYFEELSYSNDVFNLNLKLNSGLLALGVLDNIEILGYNGANLVASESLTDLLNLDLLGLFQNDENAEVPFAPGAPIDRIVIRFSSLVTLSLPQKLEIHEVKKVPGPPTFDASSQDVDICKGESASLIAVADPNDLELRWYDSAVDGTLLGTVASGTPFVTSPILADTTFYVAAAEVGCPEESERTPVEVTVVPSPEATDITVTGNESTICSSNTVTLVPSSALTGTFNWYLDANKNNPITDGMVDSGITYNIDANDELTITGLSGLNSPYTYYVSITDSSTGCENMDGELKSVVVTIQDNSLAPTITLDSNITADDIVNSNEAIGLVNITGVVGGDAQVNDVVTLTINNVSYQGNVAADLSFSIPVNGSDLIADADTTIDASVETTNGICTNTGIDTESYTVDTTAPNPPTVNTLLTNDTTPTITGTADSADALTVTLDGITYTEGDGNLTDNGDGTWTLTVPAGSELAEGTYDVAAITTDLAGNTANDATTDELTIDLTDPTPPTVNTLLTNDTTPTITGTVDSADVLTVTLNGITYTEGDGNLTDNGDGTWTLTVPAGSELAEGTYDVAATTTDLAGNTANDTTTDELTIDLTDPTPPTVNTLLTNDTTPTITGTADSADVLTVTLNGTTYTEGDGNLTDNGDGTWTLTVPAGNELAEGTYDVAATTTDLASNTANDTTTDELTIDLTDPTVPTVNTLLTNDTTPTITGTADSADALTVTLDGITYTEGDGNLTDNGDGTWTLTVPAGSELAEGTYDVAATTTDLAGNTANDATTDELTIDLTDPTPPTVNTLLTNDTTPTITGTADSADVLTVTLNGTTYTEGDGNLTDNGDGTWTLTVPAGSELAEGTYDVAATTTDLAGNTANDTTTNELTIDLTDPTPPTVNTLLTNDTTPTITGTADSADVLTVTLNGITYTEGDGNLTDNGDGTWTLTVPAGNELAEGTYDVAATTTDLAGNTANDATTDELTIDLTDPTPPTVNTLLTNDTTPTITGTADSADILTVTLNGTTYTEGDGNLTDNGDGTWTLNVPVGSELAEGTYDVSATTTDLAGNTASDATTDELTIDLTDPTPPTVNALLTNDTTPTITGTADSADALTVTLNGTTYTEGDGNLTDNGDGTWTLTVPTGSELAEGTYDVAATTTDLAGNTANDATTDELTIDLTDPTPPTVNTLLTNDTTPTITGTADSADILTVTLDGTTYTEGDGNLTDNGDGTWTLTVPAGSELAEGTYDVAATTTDLAGNTASDATTDELTIDLTDPTPPTVNTLLTNNTTPTITGAADSADILTVTLDGITYTEGDGNLTDNGDGTWTLTVPAGNELAEGTYDVSATTTDLAGNTANDATTDELSLVPLQTLTTNSTNQEFCAFDRPSLNDIQINESNILWYDNNIGGNLLDHSTLLEHQKTYYASLLLGDLESTARLGITVNLIQPPSATSESLTQVFSTADNPTLGDIQVNESNIIWYDAPVLGNILDFDTTLVDGTNYYAALIDSNCESINRLAIRVQVDGISDLIISKEASSQNPMVGENVNFIITVTNDGDTNFTDLTINERIESGFTFMQYTATKGTYNPSNGVWSINNIGPREQAALNITVTVKATGSYFNGASISKSTPLDNNLNNNSAEIVLEPSCLKVFNEFTPNDDGDNDYFRIDCIEMYPESDFQVFNRYGALVYQKKGYQNDWRGLANVKGVLGKGEPLPTGTYFYILKTDDLSESKTGWLFLRKD